MMRQRRWRESWTVMLEWLGNKTQVLPLIEHHIRLSSDGSGTMLACGLNDATWTCYKKADATHLFGRLKYMARWAGFSPYVRIQLFHDFKDVPIQFGLGGTISMKDAGKGTKRLEVYRRGKPPDFKLCRRPPRARKKKSAPSLKPKQKGAKRK